MRRFVSIFLICFLTNISVGQVKKQISVPHYENGDTSFWYKWQSERDDKLKLSHILYSTHPFHFRFWTNGQAVDIWTEDYKVLWAAHQFY
ncbi:MAG: hypothetical protein HYZ42_15675 [Bacteroidetes bacterium]|nr:hypothetical protein [Bacteroidota bacterium]